MFSPARFQTLARAWWAENRRATAWFLGIGVIVHFVVLLIIFSGDDGFQGMRIEGQGAIYFIGLFLTAPVFAGRYFQAMSRRESELVFLMRPAAVFEKWLLAVLVVAFLYPLVYSLVFYVCNLPGWLLASNMADHARSLLPTTGARSYEVAGLDPDKFALFLPWATFKSWAAAAGPLLILCSLQGFAVLGSLYFRAMPFIKTILAAFLILLACFLVTIPFHGQPEQFLNFWETKRALPGWQQVFFPLVWFGVPALLWLACLFALQEREVV